MSEIIPNVPRHEPPPPERRRPKNLLMLFFALLLIALGVYTGWWVWLASETERQAEAWFEDQRAQGRDATYGELTTTGFPLKIEAMATDVLIRDVEKGWTAKLPVFRAWAEPWAISEISGVLTLPLTLEIDRGRDQTVYELNAQANSFKINAGHRGAFNAVGLEVGNAVGSEKVSFETLNVMLRKGAGVDVGSLEVDAVEVGLPGHVRSPFGDVIENLNAKIDARVQPVHGGPFTERLKGWSKDGGTFEVRTLTVRHGAFEMTGDGTVAFDHELQPVGAFTARIAGYEAAVDALVAAGLVGRQEGALTKAALGLFSKVPPGGGRRVVDVPLTVQNRTLAIGPVDLLRVPEVRWE